MRPSEPLPGVHHRPLSPIEDDRGSFVELFRGDDYPLPFVQANLSISDAGVLRGLHFHRVQADLWVVVEGRIQVGLADLREQGGKPATATVEMSADRPSTLYLPPGVAHGFLALTRSRLLYLVTTEYDGGDEYGIAWDDDSLALDWATTTPILSERDTANPRLTWDEIPAFS